MTEYARWLFRVGRIQQHLKSSDTSKSDFKLIESCIYDLRDQRKDLGFRYSILMTFKGVRMDGIIKEKV